MSKTGINRDEERQMDLATSISIVCIKDRKLMPLDGNGEMEW